MSKRASLSRSEKPSGPKRRKIKASIIDPQSYNFTRAKDLENLLAFRQGADGKLYKNIRRFGEFLASIVRDPTSQDASQKKKVLSEFMYSFIPTDDETSSSLAEVMRTWSYGAKVKNEGLLSEVPTVLALLLRAMSTDLQLVAPGLRVCKYLLQGEQVQLIDGGLSVSRRYAGQITSCLRLLTELLEFDGGACAGELYGQREHTLKNLESFIKVHPVGEALKQSKHEVYIRGFAIRYFLANIRLQNRFAKCELLSNVWIIRALFHELRNETPEVLKDILTTLKENVVMDYKIPHSIKLRCLTPYVLKSIAVLYRYERDPKIGTVSHDIPLLAHHFLILVCTAKKKQVLMEQQTSHRTSMLQSTNLSIRWARQLTYANDGLEHESSVLVNNTTLATLLQGLRPYANLKEKELTLAIFEAAPELVSDYFFRKKSFPFEPKLSSTWIGYASFLLSSLQLRTLSWDFLEGSASNPPTASRILQRMIPQPIDRKTTTRCLNQSHKFIKFFVIRILIAAFRRINEVLLSLKAKKHYKWQQISNDLLEGFCERCPEMKHVMAVFRDCRKGDSFLKERASELISLYYIVSPQLAVQEKFDISMSLTSLLEPDTSSPDSKLFLPIETLQLGFLLEIAYRSLDMRWWQKSESMLLSPFTTILQSYFTQAAMKAEKIRVLLSSILTDHSVLYSASSCDAFLQSLEPDQTWTATGLLFQFLDDCILRFVRKPIRYVGQLRTIEQHLGQISSEGGSRVSLLSLVMAEQWPFFIKHKTLDEISVVASWISRYLKQLRLKGEDCAILTIIRDIIASESAQLEVRSTLKISLGDPKDNGEIQATKISPVEQESSRQDYTDQALASWSAKHRERILDDTLELALEPKEYPELHKWRNKNIIDAVRDGALGDLIWCLCSQQQDIRLQGQSELKAFWFMLGTTDYTEQKQMCILLGEMLESVMGIIAKEPMPGFFGALAVQGVSVLADPLHIMYSKLNKFLNRSPSWNIRRLPLYWINKILLQPPDADDTYGQEMEWLLDLFIDGLRSVADMNLYRQCGIFERVLAFAASPTVPSSCAPRILELLYRSTFFPGGSTTLITRCGIMDWIRIKSKKRDESRELLTLVGHRILETCEEARVTQWAGRSKAALAKDMDRLAFGIMRPSVEVSPESSSF